MQAWQKWKNDSSEVNKDMTKEETRELIKNLRATHFSLGTDPSIKYGKVISHNLILTY